jgi:hypothetical protein
MKVAVICFVSEGRPVMDLGGVSGDHDGLWRGDLSSSAESAHCQPGWASRVNGT